MEQENVLNGTFPSDVASIPKSPNTSYELSVTSSGYCLSATSSATGASPYHVSKESSVTAGPCQGHTYGGPAPAGVNIAPPLDQWELSGGATYDATTKEITLTAVNSIARSPYIRVDSPTSFRLSIEAFSPSAGHRLANAAYFDENHNSYTLNSGYSSNGNATALAAGAWTNTQWNMSGSYTGPNFMYVRYSVSVSSSYGVPGMRVRNPSVTVTR